MENFLPENVSEMAKVGAVLPFCALQAKTLK